MTRSVFLAMLLPCAAYLGAQPASSGQSGFIPVTVVDPLNRFVTGLELENFTLLENGLARPITSFYNVDSPVSLAIVSESVESSLPQLNDGDVLIQTPSVADAVRQLTASRNTRKALILTTADDVPGAPAGIQVVRIDAANLRKAVVEVRNQYLLRFQPSAPGGRVQVVIKEPRGLPPLKAVSKTAF